MLIYLYNCLYYWSIKYLLMLDLYRFISSFVSGVHVTYCTIISLDDSKKKRKSEVVCVLYCRTDR